MASDLHLAQCPQCGARFDGVHGCGTPVGPLVMRTFDADGKVITVRIVAGDAPTFPPIVFDPNKDEVTNDTD